MMDWLLPRLLATLLAMALGGGLGFVAGATLRGPETGAMLGAALGVALVVVLDGLRAHRLMAWLRADLAQGAPRDTGFWGELGYRIERALRSREQALGAERQRLDEFLSAIEASPNGVLLLDEADQIAWCSAVAADHLGLDAQRDLRQPITNLVRVPAFVAYLQDGLWREPITVVAPGGQGNLQVVVRGYGHGQKLVISQDVTERTRSDAMRRDFVANVSHEIRTPLTVLAGFVETMASLPLSQTERTRVLLLMQQQTDRMHVLVADLLTLAQLEGSPRPPTDRWLALASLLQRALADGLTLSAGQHQITVESSVNAALNGAANGAANAATSAAPALDVAGLEPELLSAVANLVTNAVRYTPSGGRISITCLPRPDGGVAIEVRDSGIGIAREHLSRLTERFYRVDGSRSRDTGGTGLGLSIVKHVAQRHGGALEIDSQPGVGSCFRLVLPAGRVRAQARVQRVDGGVGTGDGLVGVVGGDVPAEAPAAAARL